MATLLGVHLGPKQVDHTACNPPLLSVLFPVLVLVLVLVLDSDADSVAPAP